MIERQATVVKTQGKFARVEVLRESSCTSCSLKSGCGTGTVGQFFLSNKVQHKVQNTQAAKEGDNVVIGIDEQSLVRASLIIYILPLLTLFVFAVLGDMLADVFSIQNKEVVAILAGFIGMALAFFLIRRATVQSWSKNYSLVMLRKL